MIPWCEWKPNLCLVPLTYTYHTLSGLPGTETGEQLDVGLPKTLLVPILRSIRKSVQEIRDLLSTMELRLVGSSLLIVYEGDWDRAELGVQWLAEQLASMSVEEDEGREETYEDTEDEDIEGSEGDEESDEDSSDEGSESPFVVRLIDFAHTRLKPGQGADVGVLKGLDSLLGLLDGRIASIS
jgi:1D-myo-inositol-tetrakisphosphate 5-kinase/inositol-polyphosphate multikinase